MRRRRRVVLGLVALTVGVSVVAALLAGGGFSSVGSSGAAGDPLVGDWKSGPFPLSRVRATARAAGLSDAVITAFFKDLGFQKTVAVDVRFYRRDNVPNVKRTGWDPTKGSMPSEGDFGPHVLRPHNRISITSEDLRNHSRDLYTYRVVGKQLILHAISETNSSVTRAALRQDSVHLYFFSTVALHKVP